VALAPVNIDTSKKIGSPDGKHHIKNAWGCQHGNPIPKEEEQLDTVN